MTWETALDKLANHPHVAQFQRLCSDDYHDREVRDAWRTKIIGMASGKPAEATPSYPPLWREAANLAGSVGRMASAAFHHQKIVVDQAEHRRRLAICHACDRYVKKDDRCSVCGCRASWKARLAKDHCPLPEGQKKW